MKAKILGLLAVGLLAGPMAAQAVPIVWQLSGVTFSDGGTATGSFSYDADTNSFINFQITTSVNGVFGATYGVPTVAGTSTFVDTVPAFPVADGPRLLLWLTAPMTNFGGTLNIAAPTTSFEGICLSEVCDTLGPYRFVMSGQIRAVPEPGTLALLSLGLAGLGLSRRRKAG